LRRHALCSRKQAVAQQQKLTFQKFELVGPTRPLLYAVEKHGRPTCTASMRYCAEAACQIRQLQKLAEAAVVLMPCFYSLRALIVISVNTDCQPIEALCVYC
jgi:hypothetical protein